MVVAQQILTDDVIVQVGAKTAGDRLGDFERGKLYRALAKGTPSER